ncbi:MAG: Rrf2 family transcriptional regulator [Eubacterium sp.]|nr:Rrf2 family transcriptional regulator [Eubacterium sp.]
MNFSKRSRYGIRALIDLAQNTDCTYMQLNDIARRNGISIKYLEQIFAALRKAGILRSIRGRQGGYLLVKDPGSIKVADIILALDGSYFLEAEECRDGGNGESEALAVQTAIIEPINDLMERFLNTMTLKNLVECSENNRKGTQDMYYI